MRAANDNHPTLTVPLIGVVRDGGRVERLPVRLLRIPADVLALFRRPR